MADLKRAQDAPTPIHAFNRSASTQRKCINCGGAYPHTDRPCPAEGVECHNCKNKNHFSKCCIKKAKAQGRPLRDGRYRSQGNGYHRNTDHSNASRSNTDSHDNASNYKSYSSSNRNYGNSGRNHGNSDNHDNGRRRPIHAVSQDQDEDCDYVDEDYEEDLIDDFVEMKVDNIDLNKRDEVYTYIKLERDPQTTVKLRIKVDTGAQTNTIPIRMYKKIFPSGKHLQSSKDKHARLTAYNGTPIKHYGSKLLNCQHEDGVWTSTKFFIVETSGPAIFSLQSSVALKLITLHCAITQTTPTNPINDIQ